MIPRPTMTDADRLSMRSCMIQIPPDSMEILPVTDWTPSPAGSVPFHADTEIANDIPPSHSRTFRPAHAKLARRVSYFPIIIVTILSTAACAAMIGWFVSAALKGTP